MVKRISLCPPHVFRWNDVFRGEVCWICGVSFRDWTRGFNSNVAPKRGGVE